VTSCPRCNRALIHEHGLEYCLGCGYETPESERRNPLAPSIVDRLLANEPDEDEPLRPQPRKEVAMTQEVRAVINLSSDEIASSCRQRMAAIDRTITQLQDKLAGYRAEKARLQKVVSLLAPGEDISTTAASNRPPWKCEGCGFETRGRGIPLHRETCSA
jgi:hypothetical protein